MYSHHDDAFCGASPRANTKVSALGMNTGGPFSPLHFGEERPPALQADAGSLANAGRSRRGTYCTLVYIHVVLQISPQSS